MADEFVRKHRIDNCVNCEINTKSNLGFDDKYMEVYILEDTKERID